MSLKLSVRIGGKKGGEELSIKRDGDWLDVDQESAIQMQSTFHVYISSKFT